MQTASTVSSAWHLQVVRIASAMLAMAALFLVSEAHSLELNLTHNLSSPTKTGKSLTKRTDDSGIRAGREVAKLKDYSGLSSQDSKKQSTQTGLPVVNQEGSQAALGPNPLPKGFSYKEGRLGFQYKMDEKTRLVVGALQDRQVPFAPRNSGVHLVKRVGNDKSLFMGVKRTHGDADETTSQFGILYDLN